VLKWKDFECSCFPFLTPKTSTIHNNKSYLVVGKLKHTFCSFSAILKGTRKMKQVLTKLSLALWLICAHSGMHKWITPIGWLHGKNMLVPTRFSGCAMLHFLNRYLWTSSRLCQTQSIICSLFVLEINWHNAMLGRTDRFGIVFNFINGLSWNGWSWVILGYALERLKWRRKKNPCTITNIFNWWL